MKKIIISVLLIIIAGLVGYFIGTISLDGLDSITGNVIADNTEVNISESEVVGVEVIEIIPEENLTEILKKTPKIYNNPPINKEDYLNLLGEIDYNKSYELFFSATENDSAINYSTNPIEEVINFLDRFIFWGDKELYGTEDYWASPDESLLKMKGDDEDYALLGLALFNNFHDKNQSCYLIGNEEFTGLFCYTPNYKKYYGEMVIKSYTFYAIYSDNWWQSAGDVWISRTTLDVDEGYTENLVRADLRNFIRNFMIESVGYCCTDYFKNDMKIDYENRDKLKFLYNEKEFYELETTKDFENWIYNRIKNEIFGQSLVR